MPKKSQEEQEAENDAYRQAMEEKQQAQDDWAAEQEKEDETRRDRLDPDDRNIDEDPS